MLLYALLWVSFGVVHSVLTLPVVRARMELLFGATYRIAYNVLAVVHLGLILMLGRGLLSTTPFHAGWPPWISLLWQGIAALMAVAGLLIVLLALRQYDLGLFSGLTQWRRGNTTAAADDEPLNTSGLNCRVRHPLYSGAMLCLWATAGSAFGLATALFASGYFIIGARFEERKLVSMYGEAYHRYRASVPAFVPTWRWRVQ